MRKQHLPLELKHLVRQATDELGQTIAYHEGHSFLETTEKYRQRLKFFRKKRDLSLLRKMQDELRKESPTAQLKIAHAFALQLELINVCEAAYRTWSQRLRSKKSLKNNPLDLTYVLTAHPTEARSSEAIRILNQICALFVEVLAGGVLDHESKLKSLLSQLWLQRLMKNRRPSVINEAEYVATLVFRRDIFEFLLSQKSSYRILLRTWVGGDKDGHPGVNALVMRKCLNVSRVHLVQQLEERFKNTLHEIELLSASGVKETVVRLSLLRKKLRKLRVIKTGDGNLIKEWQKDLRLCLKSAPAAAKRNYHFMQIEQIIERFPALVLPLEFREDAQLIAKAVNDSKMAITRMLVQLKMIAGALTPTHYVRGLVISHCTSEQDMQQACRLTRRYLGHSKLPIMPLFEDRVALKSARFILQGWLRNPKNLRIVKTHWQKKLEVMLGYSDSAKEVGVLSSRVMIAQAMKDIEKALLPFEVVPIFFHGSGGSVARGGGSFEEQINWWSRSAINRPKLTIQGEMIQRNFATPEILHSQSSHFVEELRRRKNKKSGFKNFALLTKFASVAEQDYADLVSDPSHLNQLLSATPYRYLEVLKIGSRPTRRPSKDISVSSLRAIPWVLCWTQTRSLLPSWWGVGHAYTSLSHAEKAELRRQFKTNSFFSSYVKILGFTLAKVELDIWELYFDSSDSDEMIRPFREEYRRAVRFVKEMSQSSDLLWHKPWLGESIRLRGPQIHILNLLQVLAIQKSNEPLLRETLVGIACGMMTTG